jgi:signal transduction histidine kinase
MPPVIDRERLTQRLRALFGLTALMVLVSVGAGTAMLSMVVNRFGSTVSAARQWQPRIERFNELGDTVSAMGATASDVFESRSATIEQEQLAALHATYLTLLAEARTDLADETLGSETVRAELTQHLEALASQADQLHDRAKLTIAAYDRGGRVAATRSHSLITFHLTEAHRSVAQMVDVALTGQSDDLAAGHQSARRVRVFAMPLAIAGIATVCGIGYMLRVAARRLVGLAKEREGMLAALERNAIEAHAFNRKLAESNRDLTDFAHVASHDLQEPLRKIVAFGDRLEKRCGAQLSDDGREYLSRMQNAAVRMQALIDDLLTFSRVTTRGEALVATDVRNVVDAVLSDLEIAIEQANASFEIGPLPHLEADPSQLRQLMQNLIGNALKFRRDDVQTMIRIESRLLPAEQAAALNQSFEMPTRWWEITVRDNGIGFEQKYAERIFTVFQRLHGRSEFEGSGIGLSVCRRIAERHGGTIAAVSELGRGTTFAITLPESHYDSNTDRPTVARPPESHGASQISNTPARGDAGQPDAHLVAQGAPQ